MMAYASLKSNTGDKRYAHTEVYMGQPESTDTQSSSHSWSLCMCVCVCVCVCLVERDEVKGHV